MQKLLKISVFVLAGLCVLTLYSVRSHAMPSSGIDDTFHDLSALGGSKFAYDTEQVCVFCHTPHGANSSVTSRTYWDGSNFTNAAGQANPMLLWNRNISTNATTYLLYSIPISDSVTKPSKFMLEIDKDEHCCLIS